MSRPDPLVVARLRALTGTGPAGPGLPGATLRGAQLSGLEPRVVGPVRALGTAAAPTAAGPIPVWAPPPRVGAIAAAALLRRLTAIGHRLR
jgi:hypothetical protein